MRRDSRGNPSGSASAAGPLRTPGSWSPGLSGEGGSPAVRAAPLANWREALNRGGTDAALQAASPLRCECKGAPDWIQLLPAGPAIRGDDGREFLLEGARAVARDSMLGAEGEPVKRPVDWEHATILKGRKGERAPAAGWITAMESREDGVWGLVEWNDSGRWSIESKEYLYISPVLELERGSTRIRRIKSAGLTNDPNLSLAALNRAGGEGGQSAMDEKLRKLLKRIAAALGMDAGDHGADAVEAQCRALVTERDEALNRAGNPPLAEFVPRAQYDAALNRASEAETRLADREKADLDARVDAAIEKALDEGRIVPAQRKYFEAQCRREGGLAEFEEFCKSTPKIADGGGGSARPPEASNRSGSESREARSVRKLFGNTKADVDKYAPREVS